MSVSTPGRRVLPGLGAAGTLPREWEALPAAHAARPSHPVPMFDPRPRGTPSAPALPPLPVAAGDVFDVLSHSRARLHAQAALGDGLAVAHWSNAFDATRYRPGHHTLSLYLSGGHGTYRRD